MTILEMLRATLAALTAERAAAVAALETLNTAVVARQAAEPDGSEARSTMLDTESATLDATMAQVRSVDEKLGPLQARITELEQSLAASEARVVELERERDEASRLADEVAGFYRTAVAKLVAAESAASTAMRDGMMEAARIAEYEADYAPMPSTAFGAHIAKAIRTARNPAGDSEADKTKKMSVTPEFCRIVAIGIGFGEDAKDVQGFVSHTGSAIEEAELLEWWWDCAKRASTIAGYNIIGFDLPVIYVRSAILGVKPTRKFDMRPWGTDVLDLMATRWPRGNQMKLKDLARVMGLDVPAGDCDGPQVAALYRDDPVKLAEYVKSDVIICQQLRRMWRGLFC